MSGYNYITDTGTIVPDTETVLSEVQKEWTDNFGLNLDLGAATPQGTMITAEVINRTGIIKNNAELANQINPNLSYGTFLDSICALMGISRGKNSSTVARNVKFVGSSQTSIPSGSRVQTAAGDIFTTINAILIPVSGVASGDIRSVEFGDIPIASPDLIILDGTIGWGGASIVPATVIVVGTLSLRDPQLKTARIQRLANQGVGSSAAIQAAIMKVDNVTSCQVIENNTGAAGVVNGVTFTLPNAMWVCVAGAPDDGAVSAALYEAHHGGCPWDYGTNSGQPVSGPGGVPTVDPATGVTYASKWTTPKLYDCYVHIVVNQGSSVTSPAPAIQRAVMNYAEGLEDGEAGLVAGASVSAFEIAGAVSRQLPGLYVKDAKVAVVASGQPAPVYPAGYSTEAALKPFEQAILLINNITVVVV